MDAHVNQGKHGDPGNGSLVHGDGAASHFTPWLNEIIPNRRVWAWSEHHFFTFFKRRCRTHTILLSRLPFRPIFASKPRARKVHFFENFGDFSPVENFFELSTSYQQWDFFDAVFKTFSANKRIFERKTRALPKMHNSFREKEIMQK